MGSEKEKKEEGRTAEDNNTITGKKDEKHLYEKVYDWSIRFQNEEETPGQYYYFWTDTAVKLYRRLVYTTGNLIACFGSQGIGKSALCKYLYDGLRGMKGRKAVHRQMFKGYEPFGRWERYPVEERVEGKIYRWTDRSWEWMHEDATDVFVDLWDYSKSSRADIVKALDAIQEFWRHQCNCYKEAVSRGEQAKLPNIVVFVQKEAKRDHFFLGKMETFEIQPLKPEDLVKAYKELFNSAAPFNEDALYEIAVLSRGVFRRFKKYIATCLDNISLHEFVPDPAKRITKDDVKNWISLDKIVKDMEHELFELYPRSKEKQGKAVIVLQFLREKGSCEQLQVANELFDMQEHGKAAEMACSRMLDKLEAYGYVERWMEGKRKMVKAK